MGTNVTGTSTPTVFASGTKSQAPGVSLRPGWTTANVIDADDMNNVEAFLQDLRTEARANVVNVKHHGATGDGTTDDTAAVAAAYAALGSNGGTLFFPYGSYKFNLSIIKGGVTLRGVGPGNVNTGLGGTRFYPADLASPLLSIGDGTTDNVRGINLYDVILCGDGTNATGDGVVLNGARDVRFFGSTITGFGRDGLRITSSATRSTVGVYFIGGEIAACRRSGYRAEFGSTFVTDIAVLASHINGWSLAASHAIYLDSTELWLSATYVDAPSTGAGDVTMVKTGSANPIIKAHGCSFDNAGGASAVMVDVSSYLAQASRLSSAISGTYVLAGSVAYSDGTVQPNQSLGGHLYQHGLLNAYVLNSLRFSQNEADTSGAIYLTRSTTGSNDYLQVNGGRLFAERGFWGPLTALTQAANVTPTAATSNNFVLPITSGSACAIQTPSNAAAGQRIGILLRNESGGAASVTWAAAYKLPAGWAAPATGTSQWLEFIPYSGAWVCTANPVNITH